MQKPVGMEVAVAVAEAVALCRPDVIAVYPITPNTHVAEHLSDIVANGRLDAEFITVESEHSAMSAVMGASGAGARTFTATSSQGLMYMHEVLPIASSMRLPVVMAIGNRAVSGPINIWNDHSDIMLQRDIGWLSLFVENGQQAVDMYVQAFKIAEHRDVLLPINVNMDGFQLTHVVEPVVLPTQKEVDAFLPVYKPVAQVHPDKPLSMGTLGLPDIYTEACRARDYALVQSKRVVLEVWAEWEKKFGRKYEPVTSYRTDGADTVLMTMGSMTETAQIAIDELRSKGKSVGLLSLKLWRPFPYEELRKAVEGMKLLIVADRAVSYGGPGGPVCSEVRSALYHDADRPEVVNYIIGLGGRDVKVEDFLKIIESAPDASKRGDAYQIYGVRE